jgi:hypothetical protein
MEANVLSRLGTLGLLTGNYAQAAGRFEANLALSQQAGDRQGLIFSMYDMGRMDFNLNEYARASRWFADIARIGAEINAPPAVLVALIFQGLAASGMGNALQADEFARQAIDYWRTVEPGEFPAGFITANLEHLALLLVDREPDLAARVFSAIDHSGQIFRELNTAGEIAWYQRARDRARQALGEERYAAARAAGKRLSVDQALALALQE